MARDFKNAPTWWRKINTINQDKDGFLWVVTDNGLFRYKGLRFERFGREDGLPQDDVTALAVSPAREIPFTPARLTAW